MVSTEAEHRIFWSSKKMSLALLYWIDGLDLTTTTEKVGKIDVAGLVVLDRWSRPISDDKKRSGVYSVAGLVVLDRWSRHVE